MPHGPENQLVGLRSRFGRRATLRVGAAVSLVGVAGAIGRALSLGNPGSAARAAPEDTAASPVASPAATFTVLMTTRLRFDPDRVTIGAGETITWLNDSILPHTATGDPAQNPVAASHPEYVQLPGAAEPWGSALLQPGQSYTHRFVTPGEYRYVCVPHILSGMRGTILVECEKGPEERFVLSGSQGTPPGTGTESAPFRLR